MSFLNPLLLAGLGAISVPILIHLLNRRKFQKVAWAAMRFLKLSVEQNQRRLRLEDLLLLALRCLLVALLALALARPVAGRLGRSLLNSQVTAVLILDNSLSMGMSDGTMTRFEKARKAALQAVDLMPGGSSVAVLLASDTVEAAIPEPTFDLGLVRRVLGTAALSDRGTDLAPAIHLALDTLQRRLLLRGEIYLFTDGQASGWRRSDQLRRALDQAREKIRCHVLFVGNHEDYNVGVSDLEVGSGLIPVKQPVRFKARVTNYGRQDVPSVRVTLNVDSEPPCDEFTVDMLPAGGSRDVAFFARFRSDGFHSVTARINDDRLPADDRRTIVVHALREVRVLLVDGERGKEPRESETFFLRHALQPVPAEEAAGYFIKPVVIPPSELGGVHLGDYQAVMLANVPEFAEATARNLEGYLRRGGGVAIFPGARLNRTFYNSVLSGKLGLLPATFGPARGRADQDEKSFSLQDKHLEHPMVALWNDPASGTLGSARFYCALELVPVIPPATNAAATLPPGSPVGSAGQDRTIIRFADDQPAAMEREVGLGRLIMFASTANTAWNDLPMRPAFVPLVHRLLGTLVERQEHGLNVRVGEKFVRQVPTEWLGREVVVTGPGATSKQPHEIRRIEMPGGWPALQYEPTELGGVYEVAVNGVEPAPALRFAAQPDPGESALDELTVDQKTALSAVASVGEWSPGFSWKEQVERERRGAEVWLPLLVAALAVALLEMVVGQWFSRSR